MTPSDLPSTGDYLPISMLNQLEYCERRFYLMHVLGEMEVNAHVLEGSLQHERVHQADQERQADRTIYRRVYVWSDALRIAGFADVVEETRDVGGARVLTPVEYKKGRWGKWLNDHVQLCAQALCLEERAGVRIERGYVFYFGVQRRQEVVFTRELRARTEQAIRRAHALVAAGMLPPPITHYAKCRECSLEPICLPREVLLLTQEDQRAS